MKLNTSRRDFLKAFGSSFAFVTVGRAFAVPHGSCSAGTPRLVFGAVSDVHVDQGGERPASPANFEKALAYFKAQGAQAVVVGGDIANCGLVEEFESFAATWRTACPSGVVPVFVTGNHDYLAMGFEARAPELYPGGDAAKHKLSNDYPGHWRRCLGEPYEPIFLKKVNGYVFIGSHWAEPGLRQYGRRLRAFLEAHRDEIPKDRPFFYVQHPAVKGTSCGDFGGGSDDGETTKILKDWPNAVALTGHTHYALTDERSVWQGDFTAVNLGCLRYAGFCRTANADRKRGYENARTPKNKDRAELAAIDAAKAMERVACAGANHAGCLFRVYDDRIVIERRLFSRDAPLGEDWVIPLGGAEKPFVPSVRAKAFPVPQFAVGAALSVRTVRAMSRAKRKGEALEVEIPPARGTKTRAREFAVEFAAGDEKFACVVLAGDVALPPDSPEARKPSACRVFVDRLPKARPLAVTVWPADSFGRRGKPLTVNVEKPCA